MTTGHRRAAAALLTAVVVVLSVIQVRGWEGGMNADGVSYLDVAARYARGDLRAIANGYWSPLYPMLLGAASAITRVASPSIGEMPVVFAVNVLIFALAALSLARLAGVLGENGDADASRPVLAFRALAAGALCVWCLLRMINATTVTPDGMLAIWLFLASADIADAMSHDRSATRDVRFGVVLGLGYWTKAVFLPVAFVALPAYVMSCRGRVRRRAASRAFVPFLLVAVPLVVVQTRTQGRLSFGETGRLNYRWYVGGAEHARPISEPALATRARVERHEPAAVAIASWPAGVLFTDGDSSTFPYWSDPSRYEPTDGVPLSLAAQWRVLTFNARWFRVVAGAFAVWCVVALGASLSRAPASARRLLVALPSLAMLALYALTHPEGRMAAAAIVCVLLVVVNLTSAISGAQREPLVVAECLALSVVAVLALGRTVKRIPDRSLMPATSIAVALRAAGIAGGSRVAVVGTPYGQLWAHQTGVSIVMVLETRSRAVDEGAVRAATDEAAARGVSIDAVVGIGNSAPPAHARVLTAGSWVLATR